MRKAASKISSSPLYISKEKLRDMVIKYRRQLHNGLIYFSDLCVLDCFDDFASGSESESNLLTDMFQSDMTYAELFKSALTGSLVFTSRMCEFVIERYKRFEEQNGVDLRSLEELYKLLQAREKLELIDRLYAACRVLKKSDTIKVNLTLSVSSSLRSSCNFPVDDEEVAELLVLEDGCALQYVSLNEPRLIWLLNSLGVDQVDGKRSYLLGDGYSFEDDCRFLPILIEGHHIGNGEYAQALYDRVANYYEENCIRSKMVSDCMSYTNQLYLDTIDSCKAYLEEFRRYCTGHEVFMTHDTVCFQVAVHKKARNNWTNYHIGAYLIDSLTGENISIYDQLHGLGGEYVKACDLLVNNLRANGVAVSIVKNDIKGLYYEDYYSIYKVESTNGKRVYPHVIDFDAYTVPKYEVLEKLGVDSLERVPVEVASLLQTEYNGHKEDYRMLVGTLVQALCCARCAEVLKGHDSSTHVILEGNYKWVDDSAFNTACMDAEAIYINLGV